MKMILTIALFLFSFSASAASAETIVCNTCTTSADFNSKAKVSGAGTRYVINSLSGVAKKYNVQFVRGWVALEKPVEQQVINYVSFMAQHKESRVVVGTTDDFPQSGYEFIEYPQLQERVGNYIKGGGWGLAQDFLNYLNAVGSIGGFNSGAISITIRIIMADGSTALLVYNNTTQKWVAVKGQTIDSSGNTIPEKPEDFSGGLGSTREYNFPNTYNGNSDLAEFLARASRLGIPITGPTGTSGPIIVIVCVDGVCHKQTVH